jgi:hypothetical protein
MRLGKVVKSNSHCDYIVQLDDSMDFIQPPNPDDYGFGTFVKLEDTTEFGRHWAVGLVYNSQLLNPAFNSLGPRLSSEPDPLFTPDLINENRTLLWTVLIGNLANGSRGKPHGVQGIPRVVVPVNTEVHTMAPAEVHQFHQDATGRSQFVYYSHLLRAGGTFATQLAHQVLEELIAANFFTGLEQGALQVLARELAWKSTMSAMR